jgi:hypothetical protein
MKPVAFRSRFSRDAMKDGVRSIAERGISKLPTVIGSVAAIGFFPLAYGLHVLLGIGWFVSVFAAVEIAALMTAGACAMVRQ